MHIPACLIVGQPAADGPCPFQSANRSLFKQSFRAGLPVHWLLFSSDKLQEPTPSIANLPSYLGMAKQIETMQYDFHSGLIPATSGL